MQFRNSAKTLAGIQKRWNFLTNTMDSSNDFNQSIKERISRTQLQKDTLAPLFFRTNNPEDESALLSLIQTKPHIQVFDTILNQLKDLIKGLNPSRMFNADTLNEAINNHIKGTDLSKYGVWVYYPWIEKIVHILDEEEYILVRTNRNKHKITLEEQNLLLQKKIGVIGLSVGQSVSLTLAIERGCGELRIADYDVLDLTNLNRIRSGVHNVDIKKTVIVAREIAEIDPFLRVTCFHDGIKEDNIDAFLTGNGKLDLLIDECDSFDIKINARIKAKALGIPVLMEGSDRCTIDIERFDLQPELPVLHGFVDHLDMSVFKTLKTFDDMIPFIAPVTGIETLSPRMKASAVEIMSTISTWPQLASAVTFGGGVTADLARKILLGSLNISGRFFIDMDELIHDEKQENTFPSQSAINPPTKIDVKKYLSENQLSVPTKGDMISEDLINTLIEAAGKAPSGGNNQPWHWHYQDDILHLFLNKSVSGAYLDPDYISSYTSLGAAIENLLLEAAVNQLEVSWNFTPENFPDHIALFAFKKGHQATETEIALARQINDRHTNRKTGIDQQLNIEDLQKLKAVIEVEDVKIQWIIEQEEKTTLAEISGETDLLRMFIQEAHEDFIKKEMRWNNEEIIETGDGIGINTLDLSNNDQVGLRLMKDKRAVGFLKEINGGTAFKRLALRQFQSSPSIGLITTPGSTSMDYLKAGLAIEKLWLQAAQMGYQIHPVNVPLIFFYKNSVQQPNDLSDESKNLLSNLHQKFRHLFKTENATEVFMFRLFRAESSPQRTIRKPLNKTLSIGTGKTTDH